MVHISSETVWQHVVWQTAQMRSHMWPTDGPTTITTRYRWRSICWFWFYCFFLCAYGLSLIPLSMLIYDSGRGDVRCVCSQPGERRQPRIMNEWHIEFAPTNTSTWTLQTWRVRECLAHMRSTLLHVVVVVVEVVVLYYSRKVHIHELTCGTTKGDRVGSLFVCCVHLFAVQMICSFVLIHSKIVQCYDRAIICISGWDGLREFPHEARNCRKILIYL